MGFAALQQHESQSTSALEHLQLRLISGDMITPEQVYQAISDDISCGYFLNQTILLKIFSSSEIQFTSFDFQKLAVLLRDSMVLLPLTRSELFVNYAQSAALCMKSMYPFS